jgi:aminoglycoside phosphotransferase (APT) family kinase protein
VLRVLRAPRAVAGLERRRDFLAAIDGRLPVATTVIEAIDEAGRYTIERRLAGRSLLSLLASLRGAARRLALENFAAGADAASALTLADRPYGEVLAGAPLTADTWTGFFAAAVTRAVATNHAAIATVADPETIRANALALLAPLPARPRKGLVHGDYFPGNVLVDEDLRVSGLVDFSSYTLVGDPLYDAAGAALFLEMIEEATAEDVALVRAHVLARHGEALVLAARFYRAYAALMMADPALAAPPYPKLFAWSLANLRRLAQPSPIPGLGPSDP